MAEGNGRQGYEDDEEEHPVFTARFVHHLWFPTGDQMELTLDEETDSVALHVEDGFLYVIATFDPEELPMLAEQLEDFKEEFDGVSSRSTPYEGPIRTELHLFEADLNPGGAEDNSFSFTLSEADDPDVAVVCHVDEETYDRVVRELRSAAQEFPSS